MDIFMSCTFRVIILILVLEGKVVNGTTARKYLRKINIEFVIIFPKKNLVF